MKRKISLFQCVVWEILQEDLKAEMEADMEAGLIKDPFVAGETVVKKFYCFPFESTILHLNAFAFGCFLFAFIHTQGDPKFPNLNLETRQEKRRHPQSVSAFFRLL